MITNLKVLEYLDIISPVNSQTVEEIRSVAKENYIPIIKRDTENLLKFVLKMQNPKSILEIGCAVGYSAIVMLENSGADIVTVEKMPERVEEAKKNIKYANLEDRAKIIEGDAGEILERLVNENKKFDFIFMDAAKAQYITWLPTVKALLKDKGIIFSDNCLQEGDLLESSFAIRKRDKTIHKRMRDYIYLLLHDEDLESWIFSIGDGVLLSRSRR
ncbi:O-methyltransferase [Lachnoanaerobaculum gingivalis]|uniref:tRNA 5-hydroxyuridine methyltransferase n=1 Tax=Lachnoanaerobaculum gingivalis TaxID=2490855 RepID=A0A3P3QYI5_9FIRM|nr:O-methyltransferase [Lachnoanaerobaculum gingivalis]RKW41629.1 MAG: O-methyltransferase [Lachnospiraceae bacterium]RRJ25383.1 O-methyltransferase [Lachnoanaerobaculum gingivalis]